MKQLLTASVLLGSTLCAQGDFAFDKASTATFGGTLNLNYTGAPQSKPMMFMLSTNGGPTPLKLLFGGTDSRSIEVGVDLVSMWLLLGTTPTGNGGFSLGIPTTIPSLQGLHVHLQLMTGGGAGPNLVDKISNKIVIVPGKSGTADLLASKLGDGRSPVGPGRGLASSFPIGGGRVMLAGGGTGNILGAAGLKTTEIYDFRTMRSVPGPDMGSSRALQTATVLKNGQVLVTGGVDALGGTLSSCELYNPTTNKFTAAAAMGTKRAGHTATLLNDGRVLVVAGTNNLTDPLATVNGLLNTAEIYNPTTNTWSAAASIKEKVIGPGLTTLANGKVLVSGGAKLIRGFLNIPLRVESITTCQIYTPSTTSGGSWANTGSMRQNRCVHALNTIRLKDGRVLVTGGIRARVILLPPDPDFRNATAVPNCEYYNPTSGTWTALPNLSANRLSHTANEMPNGRVLVAGGGTGAIDKAISVASIQEFNPATNTFVRTWNMKTARATHSSAVLPDGTLILFGGSTSASATAVLRTLEIVHQ